VNLGIDRQSLVPFYHQLKQAIAAAIEAGELKPGDKLPSEFSLAEKLGISRLVVHRALRELVGEGALERKRAVGTFVAQPARREFLVEGSLFSLSEALAKSELESSNRILTQETVPAPEEVRQALRLPEAARVVHLLSLRSVRKLPFALEDMYFSAQRYPAMATRDLNNRSTYAALEELYGERPQEAVDRISADGANRQEAALLGLRFHQPVLKLKRLAVNKAGEPIELTTVTFHADRYRIVSRVRRAEP
jgi:GntR family transcriptional regulator